MYNPEILYLIGRMRHDFFLQEAEQRRLANSAAGRKPVNQGVGLKIIKWFKSRLAENNERPIPSLEKQSMLDTCFPETNS